MPIYRLRNLGYNKNFVLAPGVGIHGVRRGARDADAVQILRAPGSLSARGFVSALKSRNSGNMYKKWAKNVLRIPMQFCLTKQST